MTGPIAKHVLANSKCIYISIVVSVITDLHQGVKTALETAVVQHGTD